MSLYRKDVPEHLDRALQSVWTDQTLKPDKLVIIIDGPLPESLKNVLEKWKTAIGEKLFFISHKQNLGLTRSLNDGIEVITTDLIARMDSDDISLPHRFEQQHHYLEEHPDIDIVGGSLQEFNDTHENLGIRHYPYTHEEAVKTMHKICPLAHPSVMMRRRIFDAGLRYNERFRTSQDIALWYDAVCSGCHIANIAETVIRFRLEGDVYARRGRSKAWNEFLIYINGIRRLHGLFTLKYFFPVSRLIFRLMPVRLIRWGYQSRLRRMIANEQPYH